MHWERRAHGVNTGWEQWGTGGKGKKHESHLKGRKLGCHLVPLERPLLWQRSLNPVYDIRPLTALKPHPSLFPVYPQQLIKEPGAPSIGEGGRARLSKPGTSHAGPIPQPHGNPEPAGSLAPFLPLSAFQTCENSLPCSPQRPQLFNPNLFIPSWYVEATGSLHI